MKILTFDPAKRRKVLCGELIGDTLFRWVKPEHFMQVVQGYGIQEVVFQEILRRGVKVIVLKETNAEQKWEANVETWKYKSRVADYGHGKQRFLSLKYMKTHLLREPDRDKEIKRKKTIEQAKLFKT